MSDRPEESEEYITEDEEEVVEDFDDIDMEDDEEVVQGDFGFLLTSLMATPEGDTVCSALVNIASQLEMQNKILIKMLAKLSKKDS